MADVILSYTIPQVKVAEYVGDYVYVHENLELNDPNDPESGLKYTDAQWVREHILRGIRAQIIRGKNTKNKDAVILFKVNDVDDVT